ncbi:MAG: SIMPL domain-containing protein [Patescibacteria group bacterium]
MNNNLESLKKYFWTILNLLLIVLVILGIFSVSALRHYVDTTSSNRTISVSAEGKTVVTPDIAKINFSVVTEGSDTVKISEENIDKMNKAIDFVKTEGIESKDIQTAGYNLSPKYEYDENKKKSFISGYALTQTVYIKIRNFSKISNILGMLPGFGINDISSLSFDIENQDESLKIARDQAFEKAFIKAKEMAKKNRVRIKRVITFSDYQNNYPIYAKSVSYGIGGGAVAESASVPSIEPGSQEVTVNVSITYEID